MRDCAFSLRQNFIRQADALANDPLTIKREALRERLHSEGKALIGEEAEAKRRGWKVFHAHKGWTK